MSDPFSEQVNYAELTTAVVAAYVARNHVQPSEMPALIRTVHETLSTLDTKPEAEPEPAKLTPPVSIRKSVTDDYLISMEDGKHYQSLKRHLSKRGLTPDAYRAKWGLPKDYPMTAPTYSARRSELAKSIGLGRKAAEAAPEPAAAPKPETEPEEAAPAPKRERRKAA